MIYLAKIREQGILLGCAIFLSVVWLVRSWSMQEDLEEYEVKDGLALAEAEAAEGSGSSTVSALVAAAVGNTLTQSFTGKGSNVFPRQVTSRTFFLLWE